MEQDLFYVPIQFTVPVSSKRIFKMGLIVCLYSFKKYRNPLLRPSAGVLVKLIVCDIYTKVLHSPF